MVLKRLTVWPVVTKTDKVRWPEEGEIKGPDANSRANGFFSCCEEVKSILRREL